MNEKDENGHISVENRRTVMIQVYTGLVIS